MPDAGRASGVSWGSAYSWDMLNVQSSRERQKRLLAVLAERGVDAAVIGASEHVYYFTAHHSGWVHRPGFVLRSDGRSWLTMANHVAPPSRVAADEIVSYEANWGGTLRQDQADIVSAQVLDELKRAGVTRLAIDASAMTSRVAMNFSGHVEAIDDALFQLRRVKDADELATIRQAIACTHAMYKRAREIIEPGVPELRVFNELHAAAVNAGGGPLTAHLGNDYAVGKPGGPAREGVNAEAGQLYILDLGPAVGGYFADNCRTFAVNHRPTDAQHNAWEAIRASLALVESLARPGVRCRDLWTAVDEQLKSTLGTGLPHHLGHGVGLSAHEYPHLNMKWDDVLLEGEIFTAEPGTYSHELNGGIRLENQYLVEADGVRNLVDFPLDL